MYIRTHAISVVHVRSTITLSPEVTCIFCAGRCLAARFVYMTLHFVLKLTSSDKNAVLISSAGCRADVNN